MFRRTPAAAYRTAREETTRAVFHIKQVHTPENCPYGKGGSPSLRDESVEEVVLKAAYGAFMEHTVYMVVETEDLEKLNEFLHPGMKVCTTTITPVSAEPLPRWNA